MTKQESKIDQRVDELLKQLTLQEKISLLSGKDIWNTVPIPRLGIPSIVLTDGPHGVRAANQEVGRKLGTTTAFPTGISMGACWDQELMERVGQALGEETRGMDCDILLGPCVNLVRDPRGGRNFETFSEDPYLAGRIAVAYIKGVQSRGVGTSLKHFAVNNFEVERFRASAEVDERTLREIYLPHFEMAVKEANPWTVMCSYNRINGVYACENGYLLNTILREEWGFDGAVISDWGAVHNIYEPVENGLDLEMPGPAKFFQLLPDAVQNWHIEESKIDQAARRILKLVILSGRMDGSTSTGSVNTVEHQALARELAESSITLLKNEGDVLPLDLKVVQTIAVIGPNAFEAVIEGGGSSRVHPLYRVSPIDGIRTALGDKVEILQAKGCDNYDEPFTIPDGWLKDGFKLKAYQKSDFSGEPIVEMDLPKPEIWWHTAWSGLPEAPTAIKATGTLTIPEDGYYQFVLKHAGEVTLCLDGETLIDSKGPSRFHHVDYKQKLKANHPYQVALSYIRPGNQEIVMLNLAVDRTYMEGEDPRLAQAVEAAKNSDVALVFVGVPEAFESEGRDRENIDLPGEQNELIRAVAAANPNTVVVLNIGTPVIMPWVEKVKGLLLVYYPGLENGNAIAKILGGSVNPSGKLPMTFPKKLEDSPAFINASHEGNRKVFYGEGIYLGYRYFDERDIEPLFPFGYGLSYTNFEYSNLQVPEQVKSGSKVEVKVTVTNGGKVAGKEVVQLYISDPSSSLPRPIKELKGFNKVSLSPGEQKTLNFELDQRAFSFYDPVKKDWIAEPGRFDVLVGSSSRDIRLTGSFYLV